MDNLVFQIVTFSPQTLPQLSEFGNVNAYTHQSIRFPIGRLAANTIYGRSFGSRLTRNIREDRGYTYTPHSYTTSMRWSGVILTSEDVRNQITGASFKETFYELKRISTEPPLMGFLSGGVTAGKSSHSTLE